MSEFDEKRTVLCPACDSEILADKVVAHFRMIHHRDLPVAELMDILSQAKATPVDKKEYYADLDEAEKDLQESPKIERTPRSMQQWEGGTPREVMRSGPLGPEKR